MRRLFHTAISIACIVIPTLAVADLDCTGQANGEQRIGGCWDCEESIKGANAYQWNVSLGSGDLTVNSSDNTLAMHGCAENDNIFANITATFAPPVSGITQIDIGAAHCRMVIRG